MFTDKNNEAGRKPQKGAPNGKQASDSGKTQPAQGSDASKEASPQAAAGGGGEQGQDAGPAAAAPATAAVGGEDAASAHGAEQEQATGGLPGAEAPQEAAPAAGEAQYVY